VRPLVRSAWACFTQLVSAEGTRSHSRATLVTLLSSSRTRRTAGGLNSSGNCRRERRGFGDSDIPDIVSTFRKMSTEPDQLQFRGLWGYGQRKLTTEEIAIIKQKVYSVFPLP
jgi:hypothetical protein